MTRGFVTKTAIKADSQGNAPTTINLLKAGSWNTPWHGDFELTSTDLDEMVANFTEGVGLVDEDSIQAPVNYGHIMGDKAAAWIKRLYVQAVNGTAGLFADVEWTPAAAQAIKDGEWKYISPEFNPRGFPWEDPEQEFVFVDNVLTGAALTNIPLFKKLKPITASRLPNKKVNASQSGESDNKPKGQSMKLEDIRKKEAADVTAEEKQFLVDNKAELTADEVTKFELGDAPTETPAPQETQSPAETEAPAETQAPAENGVQASVKGIVSISADELNKLKASAARADELAAEIAKDKAEAFVGGAIKAGQIKSGDKTKWVDQLLASRGDSRKDLEALIDGLPKNEDLGNEVGDQGKEATATAATELHSKVTASVKASAEKGVVVQYSQARKEILKTDEALAQRVKNEMEEN